VTRLRLVSVSFDRVDFELESDDVERYVSVAVGSATKWRRAVIFPCASQLGEAGESTYDDALDDLILEKAAEELVRLEGAVAALRRAA
jgi:hypothetical protein